MACRSIESAKLADFVAVTSCSLALTVSGILPHLQSQRVGCKWQILPGAHTSVLPWWLTQGMLTWHNPPSTAHSLVHKHDLLIPQNLSQQKYCF